MIPYGPHPISPKRQVSVPAEVLRNAGLQPGDQIYFEVQDDPPGCILLIPERVATQWWKRGRGDRRGSRASAYERDLAAESGPDTAG